MGSKWSNAKRALGLNLCVHVPRPMGDEEDDNMVRRGASAEGRRASEAAATASSSPRSSMNASQIISRTPTTPTPSSDGLRIPKSGGRSSKRTCAICLGSMKTGHGHALFTAECSHMFHFHCITSNVNHGNLVCPLCKATWKEIPFQGPLSSDHPHGRTRVNPVNWPQDNHMTIVRQFPRTDSTNRQRHRFPSYFRGSEPAVFDDDEPLILQSEATKDSRQGYLNTVEMKIYPEFSTIPQSASLVDFSVLVHLKAPRSTSQWISYQNLVSSSTIPQHSRVPVDLVTVLDVSGSMAGTKLALLKRAMGFLIQNLGPSDRLSVVAFSSTAHRLFHLRRMSDSGRQQALQAVNSLVASGGTNIADGIKKGVKVIEERKAKNPVCSIILLSDGQDTYTLSSIAGATFQNNSGGVHERSQLDYSSLVPSSILNGTTIPVHTFGFGNDHDSTAMHVIAETSGGTFSFIESEIVIQDAFAQCIGGILSVVLQEMRLGIECVHPGVHLAPIKSGSYRNQLFDNARAGFIYAGDLYADEERDFLVSINVPSAGEDTVLLKITCSYRDPLSKDIVHLEAQEVRVQRPRVVLSQTPSIEVDREKNRIQAAEAMSNARAAAERGALSTAVSILEERRKILSESLAAKLKEPLCMSLDAELREMQERMASRQRYEASGRAYVLSGLSSHSWQRATARGDSTNSASLVHSYQTPSMVDMLHRSQTMSPPSRRRVLPVKASRSFAS